MKEARLPIRKRSPAEQTELLGGVDIAKKTDLELSAWQAEHAGHAVAQHLAAAEWQRRANRPLVRSTLWAAFVGATVGAIAPQMLLYLLGK